MSAPLRPPSNFNVNAVILKEWKTWRWALTKRSNKLRKNDGKLSVQSSLKAVGTILLENASCHVPTVAWSSSERNLRQASHASNQNRKLRSIMTAGNKTDHVEMLILRRGIIRSEYFRLLFGNWTHAKTMRYYLKITRKSLAPTLNTILPVDQEDCSRTYRFQ